MLHRIICISIFSIFCLFGHTQLPAVAAAPFEYNEDPYDLETEQSQAKYDTRLLSEQLLNEQKGGAPTEQQTWHATHNEEDDEEKTETMDNVDEDLQPHERAASCYTQGHKYTHGQKVPRTDPCEVCLCMDGEIFCWWEKCEKRKFMRLASTEKTRPKQRIKSHKSMKKRKQNKTADSQHVGVEKNKNKVADEVFKHKNQQSTKMLIKKKQYQQNKQNEFNHKQQKPVHNKEKQQQQQEHQQQHKHNYHHSPTSSSSLSKILNFPENLPSILYYDYHTEEHEHHQHQHHQQQLKHQLQKKLQSQRDYQHKKHAAKSQLTTSPFATHPVKNGVDENAPPSSSSFYNDGALTDSDILPEPPTKKPILKSAGQTTASTAFTTTDAVTSWHSITDVGQHRKSNLYHNAKADDDSASLNNRKWHQAILANVDNAQRSYIGETLATSSIIARDDVIEINKNFKQKSPKTLNFKDDNSKTEDDDEDDNNENLDDEQDDAFHRWLTSTESNENNNNNNEDYNNDSNINNNSTDNESNYSRGNKSIAGKNEVNATTTEISDYENPFGIQNLTLNSQKNTNKNYNKNNKIENGEKKVFYPKDQQSVQNAENVLIHVNGGNGDDDNDNDDDGDYNRSVVNIDILLTTPDEPQQQRKQTTTSLTTTAKTEQLLRAPTSIKFAADLISHTNNAAVGEGTGKSTKPTEKALSDTKMKTTEMGGLSPKGFIDKESFAATQTAATTVLTPTMAPQSSAVQFIKQPGMSVKDDISQTATDLGTSTMGTTTTSTTNMGTTRQCNVMGSLYNIGDVLPQDTGNCLQCICIDGSTIDDTPRVTCSPHNCPPLVLPDLFDATGY